MTSRWITLAAALLTGFVPVPAQAAEVVNCCGNPLGQSCCCCSGETSPPTDGESIGGLSTCPCASPVDQPPGPAETTLTSAESGSHEFIGTGGHVASLPLTLPPEVFLGTAAQQRAPPGPASLSVLYCTFLF